MKIRTLIANDQPAMRARIRILLAGEPDIVVIGDCATHECAAVMIDDAALICAAASLFYGAGAQSRIANGTKALILTAASDRYAVQAFDLGAADYILEPFSDERFALALTRARARLARVESHPDRSPDARGIVVFKSCGRVHFLHDTEIQWCEAVGNYVRVHADAGTYVVRSTLQRLREQLDASRFVRVHRSTIVNVNLIRDLRATANGDYTITLRDNTALTLSRGYRDSFEQTIGQPLGWSVER